MSAAADGHGLGEAGARGPGLVRRLWDRLYRSARIGFTALCVWLRYKVPTWYDRVQGTDPEARDKSGIHRRNATQIFNTAVSMRGMLIKMCQVVGTRSDVFPPEYVRTLSECHDRLPARAFGEIRAVVEAELGQPIDAVFASFGREPVAAASLAQVHEARLLNGERVAVKVQYPDIDHIIRADLRASRRVCQVYERFDAEPLELLPLLDELQAHLSMELDFRREVDSADRIRGLFEDEPYVHIPTFRHELCSRRVIVMEFVEGIKVTDKDAMLEAGIEIDRLMNRLMRAFNKMILALGFFHADPHPGNILVTKGADGEPEFILLDFGLAKALPEGFGLGLFELMFSMMTFNESAMLRAFEELGFRTANDDRTTFLVIARRMIGRSDTGTFQGEFTEEMTDEMFEAIRDNPLVRVPTDFVLVARAYALLSGIAHTLGQRANALEALGPA